MALAQHGVRGTRRIRCIAAAVESVFTLYSAVLLFSSQWDRQGAERAFQEARQKRTEIGQIVQPSLQMYLRCAHTFRLVYLRDPHYGHSDDAIYEEGILYEEMGDKFGNLEYYRTAARRFRFLISDYGLSHNCPDALLRLGNIYAGPLADKNAAQEAYQHLRTQYKLSEAAATLSQKQASKPEPLKPPPVEPPMAYVNAGTTASVQNVRYWSTSDYTRVVIDMDVEAQYRKTRLSNPDRIYLDISNAKLSKGLQNQTFPVGDEFLKRVRVAQNRVDLVRIVLDFETVSSYSLFELHNPFRIVIDIHGERSAQAKGKHLYHESIPRPDEIAEMPVKQAPGATQAAKPPKEPLSRSEAKEVAQSTPVPKQGIPLSAKAAEEKRPLVISEIESPSAKEPKPSPALPPMKSVENRDESTAAEAKEVKPPPAKTLEGKRPIVASEIEPPSPKEAKPLLALPSAKPVENKSESLAAESKSNKPPPVISPGPAVVPKEATPTSRGDRTLTRILGLKIGRIVIDPGHGGHDTGTIGPGGLMEKDLVLSVARELRSMLQEKLGAEVILTRNEDAFLSLEERTAIANQQRADLFISIHANSSSTRSISGVETYYLDFAKTAAERKVAARENATTIRNVRDLENLVREITKADKSAESREFASIIQKKLYGGAQQLFPSARNRGVRRAPFVVLIGANMPSVLAEVAFISNPKDEKLLKRQDSRERLAKALFSGIEGYMKTLGSDVARNRSSSN